jgi:hypothetical protein
VWNTDEIMDTVQEDLEAGKLSLPYSLDNGPRTPRRNRMAAPAKNEERGPILPPSGISRFAGFFGEQGKRN